MKKWLGVVFLLVLALQPTAYPMFKGLFGRGGDEQKKPEGWEELAFSSEDEGDQGGGGSQGNAANTGVEQGQPISAVSSSLQSHPSQQSINKSSEEPGDQEKIAADGRTAPPKQQEHQKPPEVWFSKFIQDHAYEALKKQLYTALDDQGSPAVAQQTFTSLYEVAQRSKHVVLLYVCVRCYWEHLQGSRPLTQGADQSFHQDMITFMLASIIMADVDALLQMSAGYPMSANQGPAYWFKVKYKKKLEIFFKSNNKLEDSSYVEAWRNVEKFIGMNGPGWDVSPEWIKLFTCTGLETFGFGNLSESQQQRWKNVREQVQNARVPLVQERLKQYRDLGTWKGFFGDIEGGGVLQSLGEFCRAFAGVLAPTETLLAGAMLNAASGGK